MSDEYRVVYVVEWWSFQEHNGHDYEFVHRRQFGNKREAVNGLQMLQAKNPHVEHWELYERKWESGRWLVDSLLLEEEVSDGSKKVRDIIHELEGSNIETAREEQEAVERAVEPESRPQEPF